MSCGEYITCVYPPPNPNLDPIQNHKPNPNPNRNPNIINDKDRDKMNNRGNKDEQRQNHKEIAKKKDPRTETLSLTLYLT